MAKFHAENQTPDITRTTHRIDYIFGNNNILNASIHTFAQKIPPSHFTSDHKAVITLLQNDLFKCSRHRQDNISTQDELDHTWNIFEHSLHNIKKSTIPQKKITPQEHHHLYPLHIRQLNRHVITLYKTKQFLNLKHIYIRNKIEKPKDKSINFDLSTNQTKMINSILQRKPRKITLDRLIFKDNNNDTIFTNNPQIIQKETIKHYQNIGKHDNQSTYCSIDDLPLPWRTIYDPANHHSNSDCWDTLQQQIDISDVLAILKNSPSNKAPGPSQITYEDLKHLHKDVLILLTQIFNLCIHLDTIPTKWRDALLFPIPKPHDWDSKLTNTRPITLLETTRKLMVSVFSQRLNQSLAKYNILQFNNRAGVLGQSCLEPLFQIQHSIEHARIYKNHYGLPYKIYQRLMIESILHYYD
ncbi:RNA-directed DNA polymerase from mobile element jockey-like [Rhizophagus irregularis DAOM 181602=DAOM 197198]|nr:RNA-directed DNA polymerase from mobile element jockey-like [Rhizophagus irregularis DAOM 181602=DAOM 197198]